MTYYVYMLASGRHGTLYVGVTNDLARRIYEHKTKVIKGSTSKYDVTRLVWYEAYEQTADAFAREEVLKT
jgi:putative endonuclease